MADPENQDLKDNKIPLLAVWMVTYNHGPYIEQAIESVMMQQTDFDFKLYIGEDGSPDDTAAICKKLHAKYPDKIALFLNEKNTGAHPNGIKMYHVCFDSGAKYTALIEGDDYWTDPLKLQKQVGFLEANPDYSICFHNVDILKKGSIEMSHLSLHVPETTTILDLAKRNYIHTCSVIFRNHLFGDFPEYFATAPVGDYYLHLLNAKYGKIKYFDAIMGVYRLHGTSVWSSQQQHERELRWVTFLKRIRPEFPRDVQKVLDRQIDSYQPNKRNLLWYLRKIKNKIISLGK